MVLTILSDIHYAGPAEKARGNAYEFLGIHNPLLRLLARTYRHYIWLRHPLEQNYLLEQFLAEDISPDYVIANGDYTCDSAFIGVSDDAAFQSVGEALGKLRSKFGNKLRVNFGDHEFGKVSFFGGQGGMRIASWHRARNELDIEPFWKVTAGKYVMMGVTSSLLALPVYEPDTLESERNEWYQLRAQHILEIRQAFSGLPSDERVLLFCHDPTALPFLWADETIRARASQIEQTVIGHLHSGLILWKSRWLAGMPRLTFCGHTIRRLSTALRAARDWRPFHVRLCPALAGIELLKDGGFLTAQVDPAAETPARFTKHKLRRS